MGGKAFFSYFLRRGVIVICFSKARSLKKISQSFSIVNSLRKMPSKILDWIIILNTENSQNALKYQKSLVFSKFQLWCYFVPVRGHKLPTCGWEVNTVPKLSSKFFDHKRTKIDDFISKSILLDGFLADFWRIFGGFLIHLPLWLSKNSEFL